MAHKLVLSAMRKVLHMIDSLIFNLFDKFIVKAEGFIEVTELISLMLLKLGAGWGANMVVQVPRERHLQMTFLLLLILLCFVLILILPSSPYYFRTKSVPVFNQLMYQNISSMRSGEQGNINTKMYGYSLDKAVRKLPVNYL